MNTNRRLYVVGAIAGAVAAAVVFGLVVWGFGPAGVEWIVWVSTIALFGMAIVVAVLRWRIGGWASLRRIWWWFALFAVLFVARIADALNIL